MKYFLVILSYLLIIIDHFPQEISDNWDEIVGEAYSPDSTERNEAIAKLVLLKDQNSISLLGKRLLIETNRAIIEKIFTFFELRETKNDFFYLARFLGISRQPDYSVRCIKLLYKLDAKQLRTYLEKIFLSDEMKIHILSFLKAVTKPTVKDKLWFYDQFRKHKMAGYWLKLHPRFDREILLTLKPYYKPALFLEQLSNRTLYWYILYQDFNKKKFLRQVISGINLQIIESLPERRQAILLEKLEKHILSRITFERWLSADSFTIKFWLLKTYFKKKKNPIALPKTWEIGFLKFLSGSKDLLLLKISMFYLNSWSEQERLTFEKRCSSLEAFWETCFHFWLDTYPEKADTEWEKLPDMIKKKLASLYSQKMAVLKEFQGADRIQWFLSRPRPEIRSRFLKNLPLKVLTRNSGLLISFFESQSNHRLKLVFFLHVMEHSELKKIFLKHLSGLKYL